MRHGLIFVICLGVGTGLVGCKDKGAASADAGPAASASMVASATAQSSGRPRLARDEDGRLIPSRPRPKDDPADLPPSPGSQPGWDLDRADPARDYVERYVLATRRYGDATPCVSAKRTGSREGKAVVEVQDRERPPPGCAAPSTALRDAFVVDVDGDRMSLASAKGKSLARWPDGSDPEGPPGATVEADAPPPALRDALLKMKLTPVRTQLYGRGAYPVVTLAGWHDPVVRSATPEALRPFVDATCAATGGLPFGVFAGIDRSTMLRVRCGDAAGGRWDRL